MQGGETKHKAGIIVTANTAFAETQRKAQRIVHVPFFEPLSIHDEARQIEIEDSYVYNDYRKAASSAIGYIISIRDRLLSSRNRRYIGELLLPFISVHLSNVHHRTKKGYALVLLATKLLCDEIEGVITFEEILDFFVKKWAPIVNELHSATSANDVEEVLWEVLEVIRELPTNEVIQMVLSNTFKRKTKTLCVSIYCPVLREHLNTEAKKRLEEIKDAVKQMGGESNGGCRFLKSGCKDTRCTSNNTSTCKGVLQIPRTNISERLLRLLDSVCYPHKEHPGVEEETDTPQITGSMSTRQVTIAELLGDPRSDTEDPEQFLDNMDWDDLENDGDSLVSTTLLAAPVTLVPPIVPSISGSTTLSAASVTLVPSLVPSASVSTILPAVPVTLVPPTSGSTTLSAAPVTLVPPLVPSTSVSTILPAAPVTLVPSIFPSTSVSTILPAAPVTLVPPLVPSTSVSTTLPAVPVTLVPPTVLSSSVLYSVSTTMSTVLVPPIVPSTSVSTILPAVPVTLVPTIVPSTSGSTTLSAAPVTSAPPLVSSTSVTTLSDVPVTLMPPISPSTSVSTTLPAVSVTLVPSTVLSSSVSTTMPTVLVPPIVSSTSGSTILPCVPVTLTPPISPSTSGSTILPVTLVQPTVLSTSGSTTLPAVPVTLVPPTVLSTSGSTILPAVPVTLMPPILPSTSVSTTLPHVQVTLMPPTVPSTSVSTTLPNVPVTLMPPSTSVSTTVLAASVSVAPTIQSASGSSKRKKKRGKVEPSKDICPPDYCKRKGKKLAMMCCNGCDQWFHCVCLSTTIREAQKLPSWYCPMCKQ
ncbi:uncharacterized protein [Dysidea avara]|uniref:uncharacterized protein n=1 Tax=Dysidea avara TaxID=196820 RepID=UPI003323602F